MRLRFLPALFRGGFIWLWMLLWLGGPIAAQETRIFEFQAVSVAQGLSHSSVTALAQDREGFLWIGTIDGLNRYDGGDVRVFRSNPNDPNSLPHNHVRALLSDRQERLWVVTGSGLSRFDPATMGFVRYPQVPSLDTLLAGTPVGGLDEDHNGLLWVGTMKGLACLNPATGQVQIHYPDPANPRKLAGNRISSVCVGQDGWIWVGTDNGLHGFDPQTRTFRRFQHHPEDPTSLGSNQVTAVFEDSARTLWVGTVGGGGLNRFDRTTERFTPFRPNPDVPGSISGVQIRGIFEDRSQRLWIATGDAGLNLMDRHSGTFRSFRKDADRPGGLTSDSLGPMVQDRQGVLWFGSSDGVNALGRGARHFQLFHRSDSPNGLENDRIWSFCEDPDGNVWIGTSGGLNYFDRKTTQFTPFSHDPDDPGSLGNNIVRRIYLDRAGVLWVGTDGGGLNRFDRQTKRFTRYTFDPQNPQSLGSNQIRQILEDREGNLWVGTMGGGLNRFDRSTGTALRFQHDPANPASLPSNDVYSLCEDRDGNLWVGMIGGGFGRFDRQRRVFEPVAVVPDQPKDFRGVQVFCIVEGHTGELWLGTSLGLCRLDRKSGAIRFFSKQNGLPNSHVYAVLEDKQGALWLTTNNGLCRLDFVTGALRVYDQRDGLQGNEFNGGAYLHTTDGEIFVGGPNGFNRFRPETVTPNPFVPPIVITGFQIFDRKVEDFNGRDVRVLSYDENFFALEFAALNFVSTERNRFAFRLEGVDPRWIDCGTRRYASYTNLPPGEYVFRVKGSNNDGLWNETGASLRIKILPPPWRTPWAYALYMIALVLAVMGAFRYQSNRLREQAAIREAELRVALAGARAEAAEIETQALEKENLQRAQAEAEIRSKNLELEEANFKLRELDRIKADFTAMLVHDLKSPLSVVKATLDLLEADPVIEETGSGKLLGASSRSVEKMLRMIQEILEVFRSEQQDVTVQLERLDAERFLRECVEDARLAALAKCIQVKAEIPARLPLIVADREKLGRAMANLVSNAIKFTSAGGTVTVTAQVLMGTGVETGLTRLALSVTDTGEGIPAEDLPYVFDPYRQAASKNAGLGVGLGLAIVKRVVAAHGGHLSVRSQVGVGSCFTLEIPALPLPEPSEANHSDLYEPQSK
ncbi:MAG: hypothetical protein K1Y36_06150 [Blastocatellia bacterium]|nr:hypothetical protein [Blastocatellia bacterium]